MTKAEENENKVVAQRYAKALLEFADEKFTKEQILSEITDTSKSLSGSDDLQRVMTSPVISDSEKKNVLSKIFGTTVNGVILNFLKLLIDKNRFNILSSIVKEYRKEINKLNNMLDMKVTSAIELSDSEKAMIKVKLQKILNKDIELEWASDNNIIGGLIFEANDNIVDNSLLHKLQEIKKEVIK